MTGQLGWGAGGLQALQQEKVQNAAMELDSINSRIAQSKAEREAREEELDQSVAAQMAAISAGEGSGVTPTGNVDKIESSADVAETMGRMYLLGGSPKKGLDALNAASSIRKNEAAAAKSELTGKADAYKLQLAQSDLVYRTLGTVRAGDEASWDSALDQLRDSGLLSPEDIAGFEDLDPTPEVINMLREQSISAKDSANISLREDAEANRQADRRDAQGNRQRMASLAEGRLAETKRHNAVRERAGGKLEVPTAAEREAVTNVIATQVFGGSIPEGLPLAVVDAGADAIVSRAKQLAKDIPGLSTDAAIIRATIESQQAGEWEYDDGVRDWALDDEATISTGKGKTPASAMVLPKDRTKLVRNKYYIMGNGETAKYDGTGFVAEY